jgi:hypothetical protein
MDRSSVACGRPHSMTSSARASIVAGISRPIAFAVLRLMVRSNLVGCSTGSSPGFARARSCRHTQRRAEITAACLAHRTLNLHYRRIRESRASSADARGVPERYEKAIGVYEKVWRDIDCLRSSFEPSKADSISGASRIANVSSSSPNAFGRCLHFADFTQF